MAGWGRRALVTSGLGIVAGLAWADLVTRVVLPTLAMAHWRTPSYWVVARLARDERLGFAYDDARFRAEAIALGTVGDIWMPNPPVSILPALPLGLLSETQARDALVLLGVVALVAAVAVLARALVLPLAGTLALVALVGWFQPVRHDMEWGQVFAILLLCGTAGAVAGLGRSAARSRLAGAFFGLVGVLKLPYGLVFLLPALARARWRIVVSAAAVVTLAAAITVVLWGPQPWLAWAGALPAWRARPEAAVPALQTIYGLLVHLFRRDARWNPEPVADLPWLADALWVAAGAVLAGATWVAIRRAVAAAGSAPALRLVPVGLAVLLGPLLVPGVEDHHYVLAILPLAAVGTVVVRDLTGALRPVADEGRLLGTPLAAGTAGAAFVVAVALLGFDWRFNVAPAPGWEAVLQYPRVAGALILWGMGVWLLWRAGPSRAPAPPAPRPRPAPAILSR